MAEEERPDDAAGIALAAELALGLLEGEALAAARRRQLADRAFAAEVARWEADFAALASSGADVEPSPGLWPSIAARVDPPAARALRRWRAATFAASAVAASLAAVLVLRPVPASVPMPVPSAATLAPIAVAQMTGLPGAVLAARFDPAGGPLRIRALEMPESPLAPELWVIPAGGTPRSLGLVAAHGNSDLSLDPASRALLVEGATLAITMEEAATAPHAGPSGPPVAAGKISLL